jgi:hypothetical protein
VTGCCGKQYSEDCYVWFRGKAHKCRNWEHSCGNDCKNLKRKMIMMINFMFMLMDHQVSRIGNLVCRVAYNFSRSSILFYFGDNGSLKYNPDL